MSSKEEFELLYYQNSRIEGYGIEDVQQVVACPFCAAPNFQTWKLIDNVREDYAPMRAEATCKNCGRSGKSLIERTASGVTAEFVQTGGPDPAPWIAIRRV